MRLKSLEIKGFKSFADKTIINFDDNITGIVGPNGCGKSNIVDSIRWVIGEQKISQLRSENLDSLVFNGSKTRSASGLAEVSLTFENTRNLLPTDFNVVTVTRKFYKNGESEYRLNDVQCRLKDIQNLFLDTGISTDSYAIIALDMVDDLIKDKDNSRRKMLEQAAGISIYKTRKKEAKSKLEATEQDLARIEDLLFEINNQLKSLESQAKKAEKYQEIKKEYREVSIELAKASLEGFNLSYSDLTEQLEKESNRKIEIEAAISVQEAALETEKLVFVEKEKALQRMQQAFNELQQSVRVKENDKNLATQRLEYLSEKQESLNVFLSKAEGQLQGIVESISFTTGQIAEEEKALKSLEQELVQLQSNMEQTRSQMEQKRAALETLRQQYQQTQRQQFDAEKRVAVADTSVQNLQRTLQQLETERTQRAALLEQLATERSQKESTLAERKVDLEQLQQHQDQTKEQILQTQAILDELRNELAEESRKLDAKKNEFALLKSMIDSMEGYPDSVKFLHNNKEWRSQVPILSDVLYVKEEYRKALENVLEPYLSYYVVADLQEGLEAVHLLDKHQKGKANFFLLDQVNAHGQGASSHQLTGAISALSVVEVEDPYRKLAEQLLGNVFIADSEEALSNSNGFVVIEKQGRYVKGKFSLTGGSVGLFEGNKIGRAKNLEKLQLAIDQQQAIVDALRSTIQTRHNEVIAFNEDLREVALRQAEKEIQHLSNELFAIQNKVENLTNTQQSSGAKVTELQAQVEQITASVADVRSEFEQLNAAFSGLQISLQGAESEFRSGELTHNEATRQFNEFNISITRQQSKISGLVQESSFKNNQLTDLQSQIEQSKLQQAETTDSSTQSREQLTSIEQQLLELLRKKQEDEALLNTADQAYYVLRNELSEKESAIRHQSKEKEQVEFLLAAIKDKLNDLKLQLAGMKERLSVEFRVDLEQILGEARLSETALEELQATAERMKKRLENLGEVNPTAIEAFTEMKKRYDFIVEQKTDLVTAKDSLLKTIEEVEATANQKFLDTFEQVRMHFQKVFKTLFTDDDQCDLVLEDPTNIAESGIDVVAKPKGKRPSSLTQLSGGERTLTATALLFAIYLIKPAPFCILDEVDAPLDDANVGKFTNMIRQFSENSQFIIVTHNKMTMSTVDVIYGVTMQEPGVSKLVTVDFRSLQQN
ncbi:MAG: chromosome segregation protein SMC [Sphingomonadales bacterium]|nr:chromosome segregation protein SMC [Sphingomonadales bacterium]